MDDRRGRRSSGYCYVSRCVSHTTTEGMITKDTTTGTIRTKTQSMVIGYPSLRMVLVVGFGLLPLLHCMAFSASSLQGRRLMGISRDTPDFLLGFSCFVGIMDGSCYHFIDW